MINDGIASGLADALDVSRQTINELVRERRAVSPAMALRLSRLFGNSAEFWLNAQQAVDLFQIANFNIQILLGGIERLMTEKLSNVGGK